MRSIYLKYNTTSCLVFSETASQRIPEFVSYDATAPPPPPPSLQLIRHWVQRKEDQHQTRGPFIRGLVQPHPCPDDGVDDVFRKFVCIYLIVYSSIGSNGPFLLLKYCALPIASLDLIVCIYCLNDLTQTNFFFKLFSDASLY